MPTPEQLARFYDDDKPSTPAAPATSRPSTQRPSAPARTPATPTPGKPQTPTERRAAFYSDMLPGGQLAPDVDAARNTAERRRSETFEAQRNARRARFYAPDDPAAAAKPAATPPDATAKARATGEEKPAAVALELDAPEGFDAASPGWQEFTKTAAELRLDAAGAQKLLAIHQAEQARVKDASMDAWETATRADREIGGDRLDASISDAREALDRHGTPELRELLDETGLGSHAEILRLLARVARATRSRGR